jgi:hypothetical protein
MSEVLRREIIAAARAELDARKPVRRPAPSAHDLSGVDATSSIDPYAGIGAWR